MLPLVVDRVRYNGIQRNSSLTCSIHLKLTEGQHTLLLHGLGRNAVEG